MDFLWRDQKLIAEADSWRFHKAHRSFDRDRRRDAYLLTLGYTTVRFSDRQIVCDPDSVRETLSALLRPSVVIQ